MKLSSIIALALPVFVVASPLGKPGLSKGGLVRRTPPDLNGQKPFEILSTAGISEVDRLRQESKNADEQLKEDQNEFKRTENFLARAVNPAKSTLKRKAKIELTEEDFKHFTLAQHVTWQNAIVRLNMSKDRAKSAKADWEEAKAIEAGHLAQGSDYSGCRVSRKVKREFRRCD